MAVSSSLLLNFSALTSRTLSILPLRGKTPQASRPTILRPVMALVAAELVGASTGLGFLINDARSVLRTDIVILGMLTIGCVGLVIDLLIRRIAKAMLPWSLAAQK